MTFFAFLFYTMHELARLTFVDLKMAWTQKYYDFKDRGNIDKQIIAIAFEFNNNKKALNQCVMQGTYASRSNLKHSYLFLS